MMREYKKYDQYKDSGIEWIGEIPKDWIISKIKYLVKEPVSDGPHETPDYVYENGVPFLSVDSIQNGKLVFENCRQISVGDHKIYRNKSNPEKGDILLGKAASVGKVAKINVDFPFSIWSPLALIKPNHKINSSYLEYSMKSSYFQIQADLLSNSNTQKNLGMKDINDILVLKPNIKEQQKIASFLDQKTTEIDKIIMKKENLIDQLEKYKKSVITEAVTKGKLGDKYINEAGELVDEIEMRDSGVEWIGEIPEYWDVSKIKYLLMDGNEGIRIGPFGSSLKLEIMDPNFSYKVYGQKHVISDNFEIGSRYINESKFKEMKKYEILPGDILVTMMGTIGKCKVIQNNIEKGIIDSHLIRIRVDLSKILAKFLELTIEKNHYTFEAMKYLSNGTVMSGLNSTIVKDLTVVLPSIRIQDKIINYLNKKIKKINNLIQKTKQSIEKYKEYKKSLIFEAVTGKIDLRDHKLEGGEELAEHNNSSEIERERISAVD